jgi:anthranilate phosphoribosyltransferase
MPIDVLHAPLARLLDLRRVLGLRNSGHTLAKLLPVFTGRQSVRVVNHTHPEYAQSLAQLLELSNADALLMRGTEGEPVAHARRLPRLAAYLGGRLCEELSLPAQEGVLQTLPALPGEIDASSTARYIEDVLAGTGAAPVPIVQQVACLGRMLQALRPTTT